MAEYTKDERFMGHSSNEVVSVICNDCVHKIKSGFCKAFPDGVPDVIACGYNNHSEPLPGQDNDYVFEPIDCLIPLRPRP
jgi:hypothetical protein